MTDRSSSRGDRDRSGRDSSGRDRGTERESSRGRESSGREFVYHRRTPESLSKRASMGAKDLDSYVRDDIKLWRPNDNANRIRILPPTWSGPEHYGLDIHVHYGVGPDNQAYLCLDKMKESGCPVCAERDRARRAGEDEAYIKDLEPTRRVLFYLVDRDNEREGVQAWAAPWTIDRDISKISSDRRTGEVLPIDDPEQGFDIEFDKTGKGIGTKYVGIAVARRESPLGKAAWLQFAVDNPLDTVLEYHSPEHIDKVLGGGGAHRSRTDQDDRRDDDNRVRSSGGRGSDRGKSDDPEYTWDSVHSMSGKELDALVEAEKLKIDTNKADSDAELADWICEDLRIKKDPPPETSRRRGTVTEEAAAKDDSPRDRLRGLREGRRD